MMGNVFSSGKLLITSEYTVLDGALALAVPTQLGQEFSFREVADNQCLIHWEAFHQDKLWLRAIIDYKNWKILETNLPKSAEFVMQLLENVQEISSTKLHSSQSYYIKTRLQFPANFGLGSSSTLMNNVAQWADIDAFTLNDKTLGGSGYDIAVAKQNQPILFQIKNGERTFQSVDFQPIFRNEIIFIHLNQKQDSREGIRLYRSKEKSIKLIDQFTELTNQVLDANSITDFSELMERHERELSKFIGLKTAKETHFSDCPAFIKSLGAWGGDFVMSCQFAGYEDYFREKGFSTILSYSKLILTLSEF